VFEREEGFVCAVCVSLMMQIEAVVNFEVWFGVCGFQRSHQI